MKPGDSKSKIIILGLIAVSLFVAMALARHYLPGSAAVDSKVQFDEKLIFEPLLKPDIFKDITVMSTNNNEFTSADLQGVWTFIYLGYTQCPDICPLTLVTAAEIFGSLGKKGKAELIRLAFFTADPKRDSLQSLKKYTAHFNKKFIGLRSPNEGEVVFAARIGRDIVIEEPPVDNPQRYSVFHPTGLYLFSPDGNLIGYFTSPIDVDVAVEEFLELSKL